MSILQIRMFGKISIQPGEQPLLDLPAKALELFCYLLLHHDRAHTREALAEALWTDTSCSLSQKYLRQTLWQLQTALENGSKCAEQEAEPLFTLSAGWVSINPNAAWWLDVAAFEQAYRACRDIPGQALDDQQARVLHDAVELYQGDLLEIWYQDWCIFERERLQLTYLAMLDKLTSYCEAHGCYSRGVAYGQRALRYDPAREATYQQLMRLHYLAGDRTTALREYARCGKALAREFGVEPAAQTVALYEQIRADRLADVAPATVEGRRKGVATTDTPGVDLQQELAQLRSNLAAFQVQMQQQLAGIVSLLENQPKTRQQTE